MSSSSTSRSMPLSMRTCAVLSALMLPSSVTSFTTPVPSQRTQYKQSTVLSVKHNDRAFIDKRLEDLMDNDWREFRARLVAKEYAEVNDTSDVSNDAWIESDQLHQERQGMLSGMWADAISNLFPNGDKQRKDLFAGDNVGNYVPKEKIPEDPFVSPSEVPIFMEPKATINKHRWAHPIPHVEPGCVLIACEHLGGVFHQTVVLIVDHSESQGTIGIVINRPLPGNLNHIASGPDSTLDLSTRLAFRNSAVTYGGPVAVDDYSVLHGFGEVEGARKLCTGVFVGGSEELMNECRSGLVGNEDVLFVKGHASWSDGQLQRELQKGVWYPAAVSRDLILRYAGAPITDDDNKDDLWTDILSCMGGYYGSVADANAGHGDHRLMP